MHMVFLDESGYSRNWETDIAHQPFYTLSAVCLPAGRLEALYADVRAKIAGLKLPTVSAPLGRGFEIKAREIVNGSGWWGRHNNERNAVREAMLEAPARFEGCVVLVAFDKAEHKRKYVSPDNPYTLSLQMVFERVGEHLRSIGEHGYCIYDQNTLFQQPLLDHSAKLMVGGSGGTGFSGVYQQYYNYFVKLDHLLEMSVGVSEYSIGLQIADYFATCGNSYYKGGKPSPCGWWDTLTKSLRNQSGEYRGYGLKEFP